MLHIGTEKTGSTSLQAWLDHNSDRLAEQGVCYSRCMGRPNNRNIAVYAMDSDKADFGFWSLGLQGHEDHRRWRLDLREGLLRELEQASAAGATTYVISSEHCHSRLTSEPMVARLAELLTPLFDRVAVHCCLRPQVELLLSALSTAIKEGASVSEDKLNVAPDDTYYDYLGLYRRWNAAFEDRVHLFSHKRWPDVVDYICSVLGLDKESFTDIARQNASLDYRVMALAQNVSVPRFIGGAKNKSARFFVDKFPFEEGLTIGRSDAARIEEAFKEGNKALVEACSGLQPQDLSVDLARFPERGNFQRVIETVVFKDVLSEMVRRFNCELWLEQARRRRAEARLAKAEGDSARARTLAERASKCLEHAKAAALDDRADDIARVEKSLRKLLTSVP